MRAVVLPAPADTIEYTDAAAFAAGVTTTVPLGAVVWLWLASLDVGCGLPLPPRGAYAAYFPTPPALHGVVSPNSVWFGSLSTATGLSQSVLPVTVPVVSGVERHFGFTCRRRINPQRAVALLFSDTACASPLRAICHRVGERNVVMSVAGLLAGTGVMLDAVYFPVPLA